MSKHSAAPWTLETPRRLVSADKENFNVLIADDGGCDDDSYVRLTDDDFRLIAVAPELLAACHAFCYTLAFTPSSIPGEIERGLNQAYEMARAAIKKLEGAAPREEFFACAVCPSHLSPRDVEEHMRTHGSKGGVVCNQHPDIKIEDLETFNHHLRIRHPKAEGAAC